MDTQFKISLFASARDIQGAESILIEAPEGCSVFELKQIISRQHPQLAKLVGISRIAVNHEFRTENDRIYPLDEIAIIPPVSGG